MSKRRWKKSYFQRRFFCSWHANMNNNRNRRSVTVVLLQKTEIFTVVLLQKNTIFTVVLLQNIIFAP